MTAPTTGTLRTDGATLHYEVRGRGPLLLLIPGGSGGAAAFDGVADGLAADHTVATYDPRGLSRSPLDDPGAEQRVAEHADDAYRLLELLSPGEPAQVFGASSGGTTALHLLATHPGRLARVVAHEPPVVEVLPDAAEQRAFVARVEKTFLAEGFGPAMAVFAAGLRSPEGTPEGGGAAPSPAPALPPRAAARVERTTADLPYFLGRIVPPFMRYAPDVPLLETLKDRLVIARGRDSHGELPHRAAACLAGRLGMEPECFPGGHIGLSTHPGEFGAALRALLKPRTTAAGAVREATRGHE